MHKPFVTVYTQKQLILHMPYDMIWCHEHSSNPTQHFADLLDKEGYDVSGYCNQYIMFPGDNSATYYVAFTITDFNYKYLDIELLIHRAIEISKSL